MNFYLNARQYGNKILVKSIENGERKRYTVKYKPYLFVKSQNPNSEYKTIFDTPVDKIEFDSISDARDFTEKYEDVSNFEFFGMTNYVYPFLNDAFPGEVQYDSSKINIISLDIETMSDDGFPDVETANKEITAIAISNGKSIAFLSVKEYKKHQNNVYPIRCLDEKDLLTKFIKIWRRMDPDIVTGWNVEFFDIKYIYLRIKKILGKKAADSLSPWNIVKEKTQRQNNENTVTFDIYGISVMDYMLVYKKWSMKMQESYKLDHIANVELGVGKIDYDGTLHDLYVNDFQKYAEYNIRDTEIINQLEDKMKLLELVLALTYDAKLNYLDAYTSVRMWDVIIHNYLIDKKIVIPQNKVNSDDVSIEGGYVKTPYVGLHNWVCSFDLASLYPHLIMQYNISPETYQGKTSDIPLGVDAALDGSYRKISESLKQKNVTITPNGCLWDISKEGFLPVLMQLRYDDRKKNKKKMLDQKQLYQDTKDTKYLRESIRFDMIQMAKKIQLNSAYGALANIYFRWFNSDHAESITLAGQLSIRWIERELNAFLNDKLSTKDYDYVVASDTDSVYLRLQRFVDKISNDDSDNDYISSKIDEFCLNVLNPYIDTCYENLKKYSNAASQKMSMKREAIASKAIWTGKKRYILNVLNNEGVQYAEPELKMMGIEAVRSSTPMVVREKIKEALKIIMNKDEQNLIDFVSKFKKDFYEMPFEKVAFPRGLNGMSKYADKAQGWKKRTPIHVRGALIYNQQIDRYGLSKTLTKLQDGDKIKFSYMRLPNPTQQDVISVMDSLPTEFGLERYIDYEEQFEKSFKAPMKVITDAISWNLEKVNTLDSFYSKR